MRLSDGEKLILVMLSEIHKALKIKGEIEPDFVLETIYKDYPWGLSWRYSGIPFSKEERPIEVQETLDALEMWWFIERSYNELSDTDKKKVEVEAEPFGKYVTFRGFDGNSEPHMGIARYLVEQLDTYGHFKGRDFNSHMPLTVQSYKRMFKVFKPILNALTHRTPPLLSADEIIQILKAQRHPDA